jgi:hypothetical protein
VARALTAKMDQEVETERDLGLLIVYCVSRGERAVPCVVRVFLAWMGRWCSEVDMTRNDTVTMSTCLTNGMMSCFSLNCLLLDLHCMYWIAIPIDSPPPPPPTQSSVLTA